jgi:hypothetical protein
VTVSAVMKWRIRALIVAWALLALAMLLPDPEPAPLAPPDNSWMLGLQLAAHNHLHFGSDLLWTYGPLGRLGVLTLWVQPEWTQAVIANVLVTLALAAALLTFLLHRHASRVGWVAVTFALLVPSAILRDSATPQGFEYGLVLIGLVMLLTVVNAERRRAAVLLGTLAGAAFGVVALVKTSEAVVAFLTIAIAAAVTWHHPVARRGIVSAAAATVATAAIAWFATGQSFADIAPYVRGALSLSVDYRAAMQINLEFAGPILATLALVLIAWLGVVAWRTQSFALARASALVAPLVVVTIEEAFVRDDVGHALIFPSVLILVGALLLVEGTKSTPPKHKLWRLVDVRVAIPQALAATAAVTLIVGSALNAGIAWGPATLADRLGVWPHATLAMADSTRAAQDIGAIRRRTANSFGLATELGVPLKATVDVLPLDIDLLWAENLNWDPRPVLQTYAAFDPYLDGRDAAHLAGAQRPAYLVYQVGASGAIDGRYGLFDAPLTTQMILENYAPLRVIRTSMGDFLIMVVRDVPLALQRRSEGESCAPLGDRVSVPQRADRLVFADVNLQDSPLGTVTKALLKSYAPSLTFHFADGRPGETYRWVQAQGGSGLLISAYVRESADMLALYAGEIRHPITGFTLGPKVRTFSSPVCVRFWSTPLPTG